MHRAVITVGLFFEHTRDGLLAPASGAAGDIDPGRLVEFPAEEVDYFMQDGGLQY